MSNPQSIQPRQSTGIVSFPADSCPKKVIAVASVILLLGAATLGLSLAFGATYLTAAITPVIVSISTGALSLITLIALSCIGNPSKKEEPERRTERIVAPQRERHQQIVERVEPATPQAQMEPEAQTRGGEATQIEPPPEKEVETGERPFFQRVGNFFRGNRTNERQG